MHSYLITGGSHKERNEKINELLREWVVAPSDVYYLQIAEEKQSLGIGEIRQFIKHLYLTPTSSVGVGVIEQAETLTLEAQNALLKTLEEPPAKARIILCAPTGELLIPTIRSRCQSISLLASESLSDEEKKKILEIIESLKGKKPGEICAFVSQTFGKKEEGILFLQTYLRMLHVTLMSSNSRQESLTKISLSQSVTATYTALQELKANVSSTLVFDSFFFTILPGQEINRDVQ